jgi:hypothetical protein
MKFNTDNIFVVGSTHKVNQDYVLTNDRNPIGIVGNPFVVLSDGCSSAPRSDFGSRLLSAAALSHMHRDVPTEAFLLGVAVTAQTFCRTIGLPPACLSATLLTARIASDGSLHTNVFGDGAVAVVYDSGLTVIHEVHFPSGAPYYLKYELDPADKALYFETFGNKYEIRKHTIAPQADKITEVTGGELDPQSPYFELYHPTEKVKFVALMSDGVFSFQEKTTLNPVPSEMVMKELIAFKNYQGEFVQRRGKRAFEEFAKLGWVNTDDVSIGVLAREDKVCLSGK